MVLESNQRHEYRRHGYGLLITWFTWFTALNYGVLGWMAANTATVQHPIICLLATVFIARNVFALWIMVFVYRYFNSEFDDATDLAERRVARMYVMGIYGVSFVYGTLAIVWIAIPFLWPGAPVAAVAA